MIEYSSIAFVPVFSSKHGINFTKIDAEDYEKVKDFRWYLETRRNRKYAVCSNPHKRMNRFLLNVSDKSKIVDHISGDGLDNRKSNLRICTNQQNVSNCGFTKGRKCKGVAFDKRPHRRIKPWIAQITVSRKHMWLGNFETKEQAMDAYDQAAVKYFGEFARTNKMILGQAAAVAQQMQPVGK